MNHALDEPKNGFVTPPQKERHKAVYTLCLSVKPIIYMLYYRFPNIIPTLIDLPD